jgi:hypothetical protein
MDRSEDIKELATALAKAQAEVRDAAKNCVNGHLKNKYADLGAVWDACREPLTSNGLSVVQIPEPNIEGHLLLTTLLLHTSGQFIGGTLSIPLVKADAQTYGAALTYARRYGLSSLVGIVADDDDDGNAASARQQRQEPRQDRQQPREQRPPESGGDRSALRKRVTNAAETGTVMGGKADPAEAARKAFFVAFKGHFGECSDAVRHDLLNRLMQPKIPITSQSGWDVRKWDWARGAVETHVAHCHGECELIAAAAEALG